MARNRRWDTKPEMLVRRHLHAKRFRFRLHVRNLPNKPDLIPPKYTTEIFLEGCFWHGYSCQKGRIPDTKRKLSQAKITGSRVWDKRNARALRRAGWRVVRVWECKLAKKETRGEMLARLAARIAGYQED